MTHGETGAHGLLRWHALALLGLELFSWGLVIGAIVIVLAGFLSRAESRQTQA